MAWNLNVATHLGYRSPEAPLFPASAGSIDPVAQIDFAAEIGMSGALYAQARSRPADERRRVAAALQRHGMRAGCMLYTTMDKLSLPLWGESTSEARETIASELARAIHVALQIGSTQLAVLGAADPRRPLALQQAAMADNLRRAAEQAERAGMALCLESMSRRSLPGMLLHHIGEAYAVVKAVDSPAVRLIFDTSHVQVMDGDLLANLEATWDAIAVVQIADNPGRAEPGSGEINFDNIFRALGRADYRGLVELEHNWAVPGLESEKRGIANLRRLDALAST